MHCHCCRVLALPPEMEMKSTSRFLSLGAPAIESGCLPPSLGAPDRRKKNPILDGEYYQTLRVFCSASDTQARFSGNGFGHSWGGVLQHISTSLAITEWGLGVYSWFMTSCTLLRQSIDRLARAWVADAREPEDNQDVASIWPPDGTRIHDPELCREPERSSAPEATNPKCAVLQVQSRDARCQADHKPRYWTGPRWWLLLLILSTVV